MTKASLLERIEGGVQAGTPGDRLAAAVGSITANLLLILNSRKGCCQTRPDYGLRPFEPGAGDFRELIASMAGEVEDQIRLFEPRLRQVAVRAIEVQSRPLEIFFRIKGGVEFDGSIEPVALDAVIGHDGRMRFQL